SASIDHAHVVHYCSPPASILTNSDAGRLRFGLPSRAPSVPWRSPRHSFRPPLEDWRFQMTTASGPWSVRKVTALLVLADGTVIEGTGLGATGSAVGEVCFNTALTGYQEVLTDPSYTGQIVTFTFPHIGNVGANGEDIEDLHPAARSGAVGAIFRADVTEPSNYRASEHLDAWLKRRGVVALSGIDTRALTA